MPVLVQATPDTAGKMTIADRRDSFCGKMSACNNLQQYRIPYSLTTLHTEAPASPEFKKDLDWFAAVCRVVNGLRKLRDRRHRRAAGRVQHGPLQREDCWRSHGIAVETIDLSEIFGRIEKMKDDDPAAQAKLAAIKALRQHRRACPRQRC